MVQPEIHKTGFKIRPSNAQVYLDLQKFTYKGLPNLK